MKKYPGIYNQLLAQVKLLIYLNCIYTFSKQRIIYYSKIT